ncbi:DUF4337 domain-containing protein [Aneurinibacillus sp. Ricciae_BoGa-3]|uniref:DUF4337 domain-containing protein n=1 Tax=Aneurinibacillus sp. Ricciae_BoGa-3 TaxID=3022697 RepID=UPI00233F9D3F|nr:DUF4337 domain-containing protein [Aneurinibacillus sp. Ricciae_BoGa-3]WCK55452.1 DUF4337 domain-containing protein [Aneurinibacillus sp. Ricciae_BoGa-3]
MSENYGIENPLEHQLKELEEKEDRFEREEKARSKWNNIIAITISVYALFTALGAMKENQITTDSLMEMDQAVLAQAKASDQWTYYDTKSVKNDVVKSLLTLTPALSNQTEAKRAENTFRQSVNKFDKDKQSIQEKAVELEKQRDEKLHATSALIQQHHKAGLSSVFLQIAIILASVSSLLRKKWLWMGSLGIAGVGLVYLIPLLIHR